ncbi:MAG TPA: tRNA (adenosine(37)-N6)-dimethylallyltransferase MiaA [Candidatus Angelobacter sp.]|jgi:tRNA dimethylallyltransferase|nr:tRNA (adenosine(37)-N6)-dimethylallyltransferase MiaA [Candidatus Angelobacter sp.]
MPLLVVLLGPTASGKTALSLQVAERWQGEIVSCDSLAVYREFEIGTAKPSREERRRVPHHMLDIAGSEETITAGDYSRLARQAIGEIAGRGHLPIVVGGSGLYLRALLEGLFSGPPRSEALRARLRERAAERGADYLHKLLHRLDPAAAQAIHANDVPKVVRALEVSISARAPMTGLWQKGRDPLAGFNILRVGLNPDRDALYQRINHRAREMFSSGLLEEARTLAARYGASAWPLNSLGYKQAMQHLQGDISLEQAIAAAQQGHRNYAKRQMTWFRREPNVHWIAGFGPDPAVQKEVEALISRKSGR